MYPICMKHILITIAAVVLVGCVSTTREDLTRTKALLKELNDVNSSYVFIAAHRGGHERDWENRAPENSIANIKKAVSMDFEIYESDVRVSKDDDIHWSAGLRLLGLGPMALGRAPWPWARPHESGLG